MVNYIYYNLKVFNKNKLFRDKSNDSYNKYNYKNKIEVTESLINYIILNILISITISSENMTIFSNNNYITIKINKIGNFSIYKRTILWQYNNSAPFPDEIYINEKNQTKIQSFYVFNETDNNIKLVFKNKINTTTYMFSGCKDIYKIDLSNFDSSEVTNMDFMFYSCSSIISINFTNFNTTKVKSMIYLFDRNEKLKYFDLSNFDTSQKLRYGRNVLCL